MNSWRDENSRITTGKTDTVTRLGEKRQRRLLNDTLYNLHTKFVQEFPEKKLSCSLFCTLRPFHVQHATDRDRETCLCKIHENGSLMFQKLHRLHLLPEHVSCLDNCVEELCCTESTDACYLRQCNVCNNKKILDINDDTKVGQICCIL